VQCRKGYQRVFLSGAGLRRLLSFAFDFAKMWRTGFQPARQTGTKAPPRPISRRHALGGNVEQDCLEDRAMTTFYQLTAPTLEGQPVSMLDYTGEVVLVVNTARQCGFTPQYGVLAALYKQYAARGLVVLGFPCNQFGKQEPRD